MNKDPTEVLWIIKISYSLLLLFTCLVGFLIYQRFGSPFPRLFKEFDKKMWMTIGLGMTFFGLFLAVVMGISYLKQDLSIFSFLHEYKTEAIYIGLVLFAFITSSIYFVRLLIKKLYFIYQSK